MRGAAQRCLMRHDKIYLFSSLFIYTTCFATAYSREDQRAVRALHISRRRLFYLSADDPTQREDARVRFTASCSGEYYCPRAVLSFARDHDAARVRATARVMRSGRADASSGRDATDAQRRLPARHAMFLRQHTNKEKRTVCCLRYVRAEEQPQHGDAIRKNAKSVLRAIIRRLLESPQSMSMPVRFI